jgi:hypothetical protein
LPIPYFAEHQNDVFIPALVAALVATVLLTIPVLAAPLLRRARRRRAFSAVAMVLGALALVVAGLQTWAGFRALDAQHDGLRSALASRYGLQLGNDQVSTLLEGGSVRVTADGATRTVKLVPSGDDEYVPADADGVLPAGG